MHISTKTFGHELGLSCAFRQWRARSHCNKLHGYAISVRIEFEACTLDTRNWVVDFGSMKSLKSWLEDTFDHKTLVAVDDPQLEWFKQAATMGIIDIVEVQATGCEAMAQMIYSYTQKWLTVNGYNPRVGVRSVEVAEHGANSAIYEDEYARL